MPLLPPEHRALRLFHAANDPSGLAPEDPIERSFFHYVKTRQPEASDIPLAIELYEDIAYRHTFNALILSNAHPENVAAGIGLAENVYNTYKYFFFDTEVFPHNLAKVRYVKQLTCHEDLKKLYEIGIERGADELISRYRIGVRPNLDPEVVLNTALADMNSKFLTHRGYSVANDVSKEALRWGEATVRVAKMLLDGSKESRHSEGAMDDLRIALEIRNTTKTLDQVGIKPSDLVTE